MSLFILGGLAIVTIPIQRELERAHENYLCVVSNVTSRTRFTISKHHEDNVWPSSSFSVVGEIS